MVERAVGCNVLYLAWPYPLSCCIYLVGHARAIERVLVLGVLRRPVLAKTAVAFSVVLYCHVHPVLHVKFRLLLL